VFSFFYCRELFPVEIILFSFLNIFCSQQYFCTRRYIYTREFEVRNLFLNDFENKDGETPLFNYCCFHRNRNVSRAIAHDEDLENLLLSLQERIKWIDRNEFPGSFNFLEHLRDRLQGYNRIIMAFSLVLSNLQVAITPEHRWAWSICSTLYLSSSNIGIAEWVCQPVKFSWTMTNYAQYLVPCTLVCWGYSNWCDWCQIGDITLYCVNPDVPMGDIETENMVVALKVQLI
jgi:hypothetical protein